MATTIKKAEYFKVGVPNKAGQVACILGILKDAGVSLIALSGFPRGGRSQIDLVPKDSAAFKRAMKKAGIAVAEKKTVFLIQGDDRIGALAEVMTKLGKAGINVTAIDAVAAGKGRFGAILWVKPADVAKTAKLLRAS